MKVKELLKEFSRFYRMIKLDNPHVGSYILLEAFSKSLIPFVSMFFSSHILDDLIAGDIPLAKSHVFYLLIETFILGLIYHFSHQKLYVIRSSSDVSSSKQMTEKSFLISYDQLENTETLDKINGTKNAIVGSGGAGWQISRITDFMTSMFSAIFSCIFIVRLFSEMILSSYWIVLTLGLILVFIIYMVKSYNLNIYLAEQNDKSRVNNNHINAFSNYLIPIALDVQNGKDIRLYKMNSLILNYYCSHIDSSFTEFGYIGGKIRVKTTVYSQIYTVLVYLYIGLRVLEGNISIGNVFLYTNAITRLTSEINSIMKTYSEIIMRFNYLRVFDDFIFSKNMAYDGCLPIEKRDDGEYLLEFKNVSFKYPNTNDYVLKNVNLTFDMHKRMAIVGQNGAGKTTLIKLLCRLYEPTEGEILLNGINISKYDYAEYTKIFSVVFQDFKLFPLPLDQNIAGSEKVDDDLVLNCIEKVGLKETVEAWKDKEETLLYKNLGDGVNVSGGEAQKIAIARALYKDAPFVIMDEPTAALDPISEAEIYENFNELIKDKTSIFISHRMSSCKFCDEIVVFENGEIVERGSHQALLEKKGLYRSLWDAQAQYYVN